MVVDSRSSGKQGHDDMMKPTAHIVHAKMVSLHFITSKHDDKVLHYIDLPDKYYL